MAADAEAELNKLCAAAFNSEYLDDKTLAISQHQQAVAGLVQLQKSSTDKQRRDVAQKQVKFHNSRIVLLKQEAGRAKTTPLTLLPTSKTARDQLNVPGKTSISMVR